MMMAESGNKNRNTILCFLANIHICKGAGKAYGEKASDNAAFSYSPARRKLKAVVAKAFAEYRKVVSYLILEGVMYFTRFMTCIAFFIKDITRVIIPWRRAFPWP